jgi:hypothetical protein
MGLWNKRGVAMLAAIAAIGATGAAAQAATVLQYYVQGHFSSPTSGSASVQTNGGGESNNQLKFTSGANTHTLEFDKTTFSLTDDPFDPNYFDPAGTAWSFGAFTSSSGFAVNSATFGSVTFTLDLYQVIPTSGGPGSFVGTATGSLTVAPNGGSLHLVFNDPLDLYLPDPSTSYADGGVHYHVNQDQNINIAATGSVAGIQGTIAAAPLPGVAWAGLGLIGAVAAKRRRASVQA